MQELHADRDFFDWLRQISADYGAAMAAWGQEVHDAVATGAAAAPASLLQATDDAVDRLVRSLLSIGEQHDDMHLPKGAPAVLEALDHLLGASAELLREARAGLARTGINAIASLAPRIGELRQLEAEVERHTEQMRDRLESSYGEPGAP